MLGWTHIWLHGTVVDVRRPVTSKETCPTLDLQLMGDHLGYVGKSFATRSAN